VDDVVTSGGHIQACFGRLREVGIVPEFAVTAGVSRNEMPSTVFSWMEEKMVPEFMPPSGESTDEEEIPF